MGFRIQKSLIYKYVSYRFKRECLNEPSLDCMSPSEKEGLCVAVAKKTSWIFLVFGCVYCCAVFWFTHYLWMFQEQSTFAKWLVDTLQSANDIIQGDWGYGMMGKRDIVFRVFFTLFPVILMMVIPLVAFMMVTANLLIRQMVDREKE